MAYIDFSQHRFSTVKAPAASWSFQTALLLGVALSVALWAGIAMLLVNIL